MSRAGGYVQLPYFVTDSMEYINLSHSAKAALTELLRSMNGKNNGCLHFSKSKAKERGFSPKTRARALQELQDAGIILKTAGSRGRANLPEMYAIFWRPFTDSRHAYEHVSDTQECGFDIWSNKQKKHFRKYANGTTPEALL